MKKRNFVLKMALPGLLLILMTAGCGQRAGEAEPVELAEEIEEAKPETEPVQEKPEAPEEETDPEEEIDLGEDEVDAEAEEGDTRVTMADLMGGNKSRKDVPELPDTVLWFNATYAPLTYSNGWDWRLVAGLEPTEENIELSKSLLLTSWDVKDRESALETVNSLIEGGHRARCREYMEELKENGLMDVSEEEFIIGLLGTELEGDPGRYVIAYSMYQEGIDPDYITAWDLCRVNQLYADYYLCGYMDYEEAMDASLKNSLILQKTYDSWEEMMDAYMMGYQFWQGDLAASDDSSTMTRYRNYQLLQGMSDGPYTLDWNMKLEKSW